MMSRKSEWHEYFYCFLQALSKKRKRQRADRICGSGGRRGAELADLVC